MVSLTPCSAWHSTLSFWCQCPAINNRSQIIAVEERLTHYSADCRPVSPLCCCLKDICCSSPGVFAAAAELFGRLWPRRAPLVHVQDKMPLDEQAAIVSMVCILIPWGAGGRHCWWLFKLSDSQSGLVVIVWKGKMIFHLVAFPPNLLLCLHLFSWKRVLVQNGIYSHLFLECDCLGFKNLPLKVCSCASWSNHRLLPSRHEN